MSEIRKEMTMHLQTAIDQFTAERETGWRHSLTPRLFSLTTITCRN